MSNDTIGDLILLVKYLEKEAHFTSTQEHALKVMAYNVAIRDVWYILSRFKAGDIDNDLLNHLREKNKE